MSTTSPRNARVCSPSSSATRIGFGLPVAPGDSGRERRPRHRAPSPLWPVISTHRHLSLSSYRLLSLSRCRTQGLAGDGQCYHHHLTHVYQGFLDTINAAVGLSSRPPGILRQPRHRVHVDPLPCPQQQSTIAWAEYYCAEAGRPSSLRQSFVPELSRLAPFA